MKNEFCFVYHFWSDKINSLEFPIIPSIATLREHVDNAIYVLDYKNLNWNEFDKKLNFKIIDCKHLLEKTNQECVLWELCSLPFDFEHYKKITENKIYKTDCDMIWLNNPLPVFSDYNKFCCRSDNTGIYYFDKNSYFYEKLLTDWKREILFAINSEFYRNKIWAKCNRKSNLIYEEIVLYYMILSGYDLFNKIPLREHHITCDDPYIKNPNNLHLVKRQFGKKRGLCFLLLEKSKEIIFKKFTKNEINYLFENNYELCKKNNYDLYDFYENYK